MMSGTGDGGAVARQVTLGEARELLNEAIGRATELGLAMSISVVDAGGHVIMKARMDGAALVSVRMSEDKAYTAAALNLPTEVLHELVQPGKALYGLTAAEGGRVITFGGGVPLRANDRLVGGIGVSGGTVEEDMEVARAAGRKWEEAGGQVGESDSSSDPRGRVGDSRR